MRRLKARRLSSLDRQCSPPLPPDTVTYMKWWADWLADNPRDHARFPGLTHNDPASHGTNHSDDDWDEEDGNGEEVTKEYSQRTRKLWLESEEVLLLSLRDRQSMGWEELCKRFYQPVRPRLRSGFPPVCAADCCFPHGSILSLFPHVCCLIGAAPYRLSTVIDYECT
jgi:hypothetical protein